MEALDGDPGQAYKKIRRSLSLKKAVPSTSHSQTPREEAPQFNSSPSAIQTHEGKSSGEESQNKENHESALAKDIQQPTPGKEIPRKSPKHGRAAKELEALAFQAPGAAWADANAPSAKRQRRARVLEGMDDAMLEEALRRSISDTVHANKKSCSPEADQKSRKSTGKDTNVSKADETPHITSVKSPQTTSRDDVQRGKKKKLMSDSDGDEEEGGTPGTKPRVNRMQKRRIADSDSEDDQTNKSATCGNGEADKARTKSAGKDASTLSKTQAKCESGHVSDSDDDERQSDATSKGGKGKEDDGDWAQASSKGQPVEESSSESESDEASPPPSDSDDDFEEGSDDDNFAKRGKGKGKAKGPAAAKQAKQPAKKATAATKQQQQQASKTTMPARNVKQNQQQQAQVCPPAGASAATANGSKGQESVKQQQQQQPSAAGLRADIAKGKAIPRSGASVSSTKAEATAPCENSGSSSNNNNAASSSTSSSAPCIRSLPLQTSNCRPLASLPPRTGLSKHFSGAGVPTSVPTAQTKRPFVMNSGVPRVGLSRPKQSLHPRPQ